MGVIGEEHLSDSDGDEEPDDDESNGEESAISRCHSLQEMFSRRRPSLSDCLHFVNTSGAH